MRARLSRVTWALSASRLAGAACLLTATCILAAGCAGGYGKDAAPAGTPSASAASAPASGSAAPASGASASAAAPVTTTGGTGPDGQPTCTGWPSNAHGVRLPVSFTPVSVERCVHGTTDVPGKGLWVTATLERADSGLAALVRALRQPVHKPQGNCPAIAIAPPQLLLIGANGEHLVPLLPVTGCALVQSQLLPALKALHWQTVSIRLIYRVPGTATSGATVRGTAGSPHSIRTGEVAS